MNRTTTRTTALFASPLLLLTLVGCANSARRAEAPSDTQAPAVSEATGNAGAVYSARPAGHDEFVLGKRFDGNAVPYYHEPANRLSLDEIRLELEAMFDEDRELVHAAYSEHLDDTTITTIREIDRAHAERLKEIVEHIGWPTRDLVGLKATQAAYMVLQHAGHDVEFQNRCLTLMVDQVKQGKLPASYLALLTDRIRVFQDKPQVFGTQMTMARNAMGIMVPTPTVPIEDPDHLNDRRALMGMARHEQFVEAIQVAYEASRHDANSAFAEVPTHFE